MRDHRKYITVFVVFLLLLTVFQLFRVSYYDLQPWDEALYAVRAKYIVETNNWLDQTKGSVSGLYSSVHPPVYIWLTAITVKVFGENLVFYRIWSVVFGLMTLVIVFAFFSNKRKGLMAVIFAGTIPYYLSYFHLGQLDTIYTFFILYAAYLQKQYFESQRIKYQYYSGIVFGFALMSKMLVGMLIPLSITLFYLLLVLMKKEFQFSRLLKGFLIMLIVGLLMAIPWHLYMYDLYGKDFLNSFFGFHLLERVKTGVESNTVSLGPFYFVNQLIIQFSIPIVFFLFFLIKKFKRYDVDDYLLISFFIVPFIIFSVSATKLRTYAFPMFLPLSLLAAKGMDVMIKERRSGLILIGSLPLIAVWSVDQNFRDLVQQFSFPDIFPVLLLIASVLILLFLRKRPGILSILVLLFLLTRPFYVRDKEFRTNDFANLSGYFQKEQLKQLIYIDDKQRKDDPIVVFYFDFMRNDERDNLYHFYTLADKPDITDGSMIVFNRKHITDEEITGLLESIPKIPELLKQDDFYTVYRLD